MTLDDLARAAVSQFLPLQDARATSFATPKSSTLTTPEPAIIT
jgi:hypothetical protein